MWTPERIKALRKRYRENQEQFAQRFRVTIHAVQRWEQNKDSPSGPATIILDQLDAALKEPDLQPA